MGVIKLYHGTDADNVESIKEKGLLHRWEGGYLTESEDSALKWMGFRIGAMGKDKIAVVEVEVDEDNLTEGMDHSPLMQSLFGCGNSVVHEGDISPNKIKNINIFKIR